MRSVDRGSRNAINFSTQGQVVRRFRPGDEAAWLNWLGAVSSPIFLSPSGSPNLYREAQPHGGQHWDAGPTDRYCACKRSLGRTARVLLARLEKPAQAILHEYQSHHSPAFVAFRRPATEAKPGLLVTRLAPPHLPNAVVERERLAAANERAGLKPPRA